MVPGEYLVNHGRAGFLGRFLNRAQAAFDHGDRVVIQSGRGTEIGTVLSDAIPTFAQLVGPHAAGELLRRATSDDEKREGECRVKAERILADARSIADALRLPVAVLDLEIPLDDTHAYLQILPLGEYDPAQLCAELTKQHSLTFLVAPLPQASPSQEPEHAGCGKPDCGSSSGGCGSGCGTSGGCSTGSCSKGSVKNAGELSAYFADLRRKMEERPGPVSSGT